MHMIAVPLQGAQAGARFEIPDLDSVIVGAREAVPPVCRDCYRVHERAMRHGCQALPSIEIPQRHFALGTTDEEAFSVSSESGSPYVLIHRDLRGAVTRLRAPHLDRTVVTCTP